MKIMATDKARNHCTRMTLEGNGLDMVELDLFLAGEEIEVADDIAENLIDNDLAEGVD